jgi:hypothetical protein
MTWTGDELRDAGWTGDEVREYLDSVEDARERIAAMPVQPAREQPAHEEPALGETEQRAHALAASLATESRLLDERKARAALDQAVQAAVVERPGEPEPEPSIDQKRARALQWCIHQGYAVTRPGGPPVMDWVWHGPDGPRVIKTDAPPESIVIGPEDWPLQDRVWARKIRSGEDAILRQGIHPSLWEQLDVAGDPSDYRPLPAGVEAL